MTDSYLKFLFLSIFCFLQPVILPHLQLLFLNLLSKYCVFSLSHIVVLFYFIYFFFIVFFALLLLFVTSVKDLISEPLRYFPVVVMLNFSIRE